MSNKISPRIHMRHPTPPPRPRYNSIYMLTSNPVSLASQSVSNNKLDFGLRTITNMFSNKVHDCSGVFGAENKHCNSRYASVKPLKN